MRVGESHLSKPLKIQIVERARALIADEEHWCRNELARDARGMGVCPLSDSAVKWCGLGAVIADQLFAAQHVDSLDSQTFLSFELFYGVCVPRKVSHA